VLGEISERVPPNFKSAAAQSASLNGDRGFSRLFTGKRLIRADRQQRERPLIKSITSYWAKRAFPLGSRRKFRRPIAPSRITRRNDSSASRFGAAASGNGDEKDSIQDQQRRRNL